jgi:hypothetical protein
MIALVRWDTSLTLFGVFLARLNKMDIPGSGIGRNCDSLSPSHLEDGKRAKAAASLSLSLSLSLSFIQLEEIDPRAAWQSLETSPRRLSCGTSGYTRCSGIESPGGATIVSPVLLLICLFFRFGRFQRIHRKRIFVHARIQLRQEEL